MFGTIFMIQVAGGIHGEKYTTNDDFRQFDERLKFAKLADAYDNRLA